jgi:hypothetical protein
MDAKGITRSQECLSLRENLYRRPGTLHCGHGACSSSFLLALDSSNQRLMTSFMTQVKAPLLLVLGGAIVWTCPHISTEMRIKGRKWYSGQNSLSDHPAPKGDATRVG